jgi:endonuclease/exonuclease/phosphatase family metal-dependent hydrolase
MKPRWQKTIIPIIAFGLIFLLLVVVWKRSIGSRSSPEGTSTQGNYANTTEKFGEQLKIVTWNLHYGAKLDQIISTLETTLELKDADFLLVQEIDANGVEVLAKALHYNYFYTPSVFNNERQTEYGDAVLSKWPLHDPETIHLPNLLPGLAEERHAVKAVASVDGMDILIYSAHMDVIWMEHQGEFMTDEMAQQNDPVILGGDFNTWQPASIIHLENILSENGMERLSRGTGYTFERLGVPFILDHIISNHGLDHTAGVYRQTDASDHYPVWADIKFDYEE